MPPSTETTDHAAAHRATTASVSPTGVVSEAVELSPEAIESSSPFVGQWNGLVSTTNWEKGRIISEWREALRKSDAQVTEYSDEAWARLVGGVTSQHVGRLRRAHERFGATREQYAGLYWSHFQAALDWEDAEMWLEGAIAQEQSVSQMRAARWEAVGGSDADHPTKGQVIEAQIDEDSYSALVDRDEAEETASEAVESSDSSSPRESSQSASDAAAPWEDDEESETETAEATPRVRPFADLAKLPDDVAEAFEQFKLVILSHKLTGWEAIGRDDLIGALEALKALALAPPAED